MSKKKQQKTHSQQKTYSFPSERTTIVTEGNRMTIYSKARPGFGNYSERPFQPPPKKTVWGRPLEWDPVLDPLRGIPEPQDPKWMARLLEAKFEDDLRDPQGDVRYEDLVPKKDRWR